jgi:hypothetical protein
VRIDRIQRVRVQVEKARNDVRPARIDRTPEVAAALPAARRRRDLRDPARVDQDVMSRASAPSCVSTTVTPVSASCMRRYFSNGSLTCG